MSDRDHFLHGADDVRAAANTIARAAETMSSAASTMHEAADRIRTLDYDRAIFMNQWLEQLAKVVERMHR